MDDTSIISKMSLSNGWYKKIIQNLKYYIYCEEWKDDKMNKMDKWENETAL